ncbi:hypothetical protein CWB99_10070 [Pseudoalteromonas rubra]|uniref:Invasin n=1 Tax=Pseudoalteromonas rubra TaxID=43658 RepID=A0A5S3WMD2_9GAMM|nr:Ig-like domain-containing protein [Pseudoalteromonas rubra]TMP29105.1 hypothetical protein CWB99_10070 [Pseudoalteromonas rubra]TMP33530.1 hypothetical protein CWC00_10260 [Pseudoalteromonas rubra]
MSLMRWFSITLLSLLMIACGGGGSIEKDTSGGGGTNTDYELVLSTSSASGGSLSISNPITITAKLTNDGAPVANNLVKFTNDEFSDFASVSSQLTDSNGEAKVTIIANRLGGAGTISATADVGENTVSGSVPYAATGDGGIQIAMTITGSDGQPINATNPISGTEIATVTAVLTDNGTPLNGQVLEFSKEADSEDLLVTNGNSNVQTDANGAARLLVQATDKVGAGYVQVTYNEDINARIGFESAGNPFYDKEVYDLRVQLVNAAEQASSDLSLANPLTAQIQLTLNEQPVANAEIAVSVEASARFAKPTESVRTDANGQAEIQIFATETATVDQQLDAFTATYSVSGDEAARTVASYVGAGDGGLQMTVSVVDSAGNAITKENPLLTEREGKVEVNLTRDGVPVANELVTVGELVRSVIDDEAALTNDDGDAIFKLIVNNSKGWEEFDVSYAGRALATGRYYSQGIVAGEGIQLLVSVVDDEDNAINQENPLKPGTVTRVVATLTRDGKAIENELVTISGGTKAVTSPSDGVTITDGNGEAVVTLIPNKIIGWDQVSASYGSGGAAVTEVARYYSDGDEDFGESGYKLLVSSSNAQGASNSVSAASPLTLSVNLTLDSDAEENARIQFTVDQYADLEDPFSGDIVKTYSTLTDNTGNTSIRLVDNSTSGAGSVTVSFIENDAVVVSSRLNFISAGDGGIKLSDISLVNSSDRDQNIDASTPLNDQTTGIAIVTLTQNGVPLANKPVLFTTDSLATLNPASGLVQTNANGVAEITVLPTVTSGLGRINVAYELNGVTYTSDEPKYFNSAGASNQNEGDYNIQVRLLTGCNSNWDEDRETAKLNPSEPSTGCNIITNLESTEIPDIYVSITERQDTSKNIANAIVDITTSVGQVLPSSGRVLTDSQGVALLKFQPGNGSGAGTITASYSGETGSRNFSIGLQSLYLDLSAPHGTDEATALKSGGSMVITANVYSDEAKQNPYTLPVDVEFSSTCADEGTATIDAQVRSINGVASSTFRANGCNGLDTVVATITSGGGVNQPESVQFRVLEAEAQAIAFVSASNAFIGLPPGIGGVPTTSVLKFKLTDTDSLPLKQKRMDFKVSDQSGEALLVNYSSSTDNEGVAQTTITSGIVPGALVVEACYVKDELYKDLPDGQNVTCWQSQIDLCASLSESELDEGKYGCVKDETLTLIPIADQINAVSSGVVLSSGVPDQNSFDAAPTKNNLNALDNIGVTTDINVYFGDQFNQLSGDNIVANVLAEAGVVGAIGGPASSTYECQAVDGLCVVQWRRQGDIPFSDGKWGNTLDRVCDTYFGQTAPCIGGYPANNLDGNPIVRGGRVSILVTAKGQESFVDKPSSDGIERRNGRFDQGEFYTAFDLPEAFIDNNEDGKFRNCDENGENCQPVSCDLPSQDCEPGNSTGGHFETFSDINNNGVYDKADGIYNGLLCSEEAMNADGGPYCTRDLIEVRKTFEIVLSGNIPYVRFAVPKTYMNPAYATDPVANPVSCDGTSEALLIGLASLEDSNSADYCDIEQIDLTHANVGATTFIPVHIFYSDINGNTLPAGTTITITTNNGEVGVGSLTGTITDSTASGTLEAVVSISREAASNSRTVGNMTVTFTIPSASDDGESTVHTRTLSIIDAG